jgi:hypothetical protein
MGRSVGGATCEGLTVPTPSARSAAYLRGLGYLVETVERWLPYARRRVDLFNCGDLLAIKPGEPPLLVQVTTTGHQADRMAKALSRPGLLVWLRAGAAFAVHGWRKAGPRGGRKAWAVTVRPVTLADLAADAGGMP